MKISHFILPTLLLTLLAACGGSNQNQATGIASAPGEKLTPTLIIPEGPTSTLTPIPSAEYHLGSGGIVTQEDIDRMVVQDPNLSNRLDYLKQWYTWYQDANPSIRPFPPDRPESLVFYPYKDQQGADHWQPAWKFDNDYPGLVLMPPAATWGALNPPVAAAEDHEIAPGQGLVPISTSVIAGSDLEKMGMPVGSTLAAENGTGAFVMVYNNQVQGRVDAKGVWQREYTQLKGTNYDVKDGQVLYTSDGGQAQQIASVENGTMTFQVKGQEVKVDQKLMEVPEAKWFLNGAADQIMAVNDPTGAYWQFEFNMQTGEWVEKSLPEVSTNVNAPTKFTWNDIVSGRWATAVRQAIDGGKIKTFGPKVKVYPMELSLDYYKQYGLTGPGFTESHSEFITDPSTRPVMYSAYAEIQVNGWTFMIATEQVANKGGGYGLVNLIDDVRDSKFRDRLIDSSYMLIPATMMDVSVCAQIGNDPTCIWSAKNGNEIVTGSVDKWINESMVDDLIGRVVFVWDAEEWH